VAEPVLIFDKRMIYLLASDAGLTCVAVNRLLDGLNGCVYRKIEIESGKAGKTGSEIMKIKICGRMIRYVSRLKAGSGTNTFSPVA
jgi:hypothetical protein